MAWKPKVNRYCTTLVQKTVSGNANYVKRRPSVITSVGSGVVAVRVRHQSETYTGVTKFSSIQASQTRGGNYYMG